jgi:hypothetical protein
MSERGTTHVFRATWTEADPAVPGARRRRVASTWSWRFTFGGKTYTGGGSKEKPGGYKTKEEARRAGDRRKAEVVAGRDRDPRRTTFLMLEALALAESTLKAKGTQASVRAVFARLRPFFGADLGGRITRGRLLEYVGAQRAKGYQDSTIRLDLQRLHHALVLGYEEGLLLGVPRVPSLPITPRQETIRPDELERILAALPPWWRSFYLVADEVGWRARSELRSLTWAGVDFEGGWLRVSALATKSRKARAFAMTSRLRALLVAQRGWVDGLEAALSTSIPWVFCRLDGRPLGEMRSVWVEACRRAGFGKLEGRKGPWSSAKVPHDLRRGVLRRWDALGAPLAVRMAVAGHDSTAVHAGYVGGDPDSLKAFASRIDEDRARRGEKKAKI